MNKIRCAIIDDEQPARKLIANFASKLEYLEVVGDYKSPFHAMELITNKQVDLLFLDIQMPDIKGTDFLKTLKNGPLVILTTAYGQYALEGYDLDVVDYLLKPFSFERFVQAVNKAQEKLNIGTSVESTVFPIYADHKIYRVDINDMLYIEGLREYVSYYTIHGKRIVALQSMKELEANLPASHFLRIHRSYIIQINKVQYVQGNTVMINGKSIPIGASYKETVLKRLG